MVGPFLKGDVLKNLSFQFLNRVCFCFCKRLQSLRSESRSNFCSEDFTARAATDAASVVLELSEMEQVVRGEVQQKQFRPLVDVLKLFLEEIWKV